MLNFIFVYLDIIVSENQNIKYKKTIHLRITMCDSIDFRLHIKLLINIIFSVRQCIIIATFSDKHLLKKYECYRLSSDWNQVYYISSYLHRHSQFQWILCCTNTYNHRVYCYTFHTLYHNHGWRPMHIHWHLPNKYICKLCYYQILELEQQF